MLLPWIFDGRWDEEMDGEFIVEKIQTWNVKGLGFPLLTTVKFWSG